MVLLAPQCFACASTADSDSGAGQKADKPADSPTSSDISAPPVPEAQQTAGADAALTIPGFEFAISCDAAGSDGRARGCVEFYCDSCTEEERTDRCRTFVDFDGTGKAQVPSDEPCADKANSAGGCGADLTLASGATLHIVQYSWHVDGVNRDANQAQCESLGHTYYP
jgi:hypothetical protein